VRSKSRPPKGHHILSRHCATRTCRRVAQIYPAFSIVKVPHCWDCPLTEVQRGGAARTATRRTPASPSRVPLRPPPAPGEGTGLVGLLDPGRRAVQTPGDSTWGWRRAPEGASASIPRKEVIQPQLPLRLPCYDFVPVTRPTLGRCPLAVGPRTSGVAGSHDVTGGVYKAREQIHRSMADLRLLATPTSRGRVAAPDPNWDRVSGIGSTSRLRTPLSRPL